ncbi:HPr family phosphocarrier protein [Salsuginibacillus kocurii]|uniref:HPr family phosphocarrier protein n=1 Tax=Salsuginibacillus kocurii TaxID=427078 RepID=UPI000368B1E5|nr:HPr family phosphocarrier protein [Salsuginibacillus kocurii]
MERKEKLSFFKGLSVHKVVELVHITETFQSDISFSKKHVTVNGKSTLGMMSLLTTLRVGDQVEVHIKGQDADSLVEAVTAFLQQAEAADTPLDFWEEEGIDSIERAMTGSLHSWSPKVRHVAKSYLKTTRH